MNSLEEIEMEETPNKNSKYSPMGIRIKERLKDRNMSIRKLADVTGISLPSINNILYGYTENPSVHAIKQIADILECSVDELLGGEKKAVKMPTSLSTPAEDKGTVLDAIRNAPVSSQDKFALVRETHAFIKQFCDQKGIVLTEEQRKEVELEILREALTNLSADGKPVLDKLFGEIILSVY